MKRVRMLMGILASFIVLVLSSCKNRDERPLTVYLWQDSLASELVPYIRSSVGDEKIEFICGNNNLDLYLYLAENGGLPDIITTRRFSSVDAKVLEPMLLDLSAYDVVSKFYTYALQYYKTNKNEIEWLPVCGIPETLIVNKTLLEENGFKIPTCYKEFKGLCAALHEKGIIPYACDLINDGTAHSLFQGAAIAEFVSTDGIYFRDSFESENATSYDDDFWKKVFDDVEGFINDTYIDTSCLDRSYEDSLELFKSRKAAMFRGMPEALADYKKEMDDELVRIPYFSRKSNDAYIYSYPSLNIALNKNLENTPKLLESALAVLDAIISKEGQEIISGDAGIISYNANIKSDLKNTDGIENQVINNEFYIRYQSNNSFTASKMVVKGLIDKSLTKEEAYKVFKEEMNAIPVVDKNIEFKDDYSLSYTNGGRMAASAILSTIRKSLDVDLAFTPYTYYTSSIYKGKLSFESLKELIHYQTAPSLYVVSLKGKKIKSLVSRYLASSSVCVSTIYDLPVASGMVISTKKKNGFILDDIYINDEAIDDFSQYSILLTKEGMDVLKQLNSKLNINDYQIGLLEDIWVKAIGDGSNLEKPSKYITVRK